MGPCWCRRLTADRKGWEKGPWQANILVIHMALANLELSRYTKQAALELVAILLLLSLEG